MAEFMRQYSKRQEELERTVVSTQTFRNKERKTTTTTTTSKERCSRWEWGRGCPGECHHCIHVPACNKASLAMIEPR